MEDIKLEFDRIPAVDRRLFYRYVIDKAMEMFATPEGQAKYGKWLRYMEARGGDIDHPTDEEASELNRIMWRGELECRG